MPDIYETPPTPTMSYSERLEKESQVVTLLTMQTLQTMDAKIGVFAKFVGLLASAAAVGETYLQVLENPDERTMVATLMAKNLTMLADHILTYAEGTNGQSDATGTV